ncbi:MAG TPA: LacI family transcriptional regulator [Micrococcales bacterium]|uniref:LacI family DNA-binding transcriptional regulator n=1 Tax=Miniimonas TaxID=947525 RepID=UPI000D525B0A|nr:MULTISPECIES: LacI family DNA-binding transcriptional regulator [Miniimonas]HCX84114.1 LacI family transcriptional regulator [Micrococcales bacterium]
MEQARGRAQKPVPTSKDVAALAGVSQSTVSYVMTGRRAISAQTRRKVEDAMALLGYHPNAGARALRGARTNVIALAVRLGHDAEVAESVPYIDAVVEEARARDYDVVLSTTDDGPSGLERLAGRRVADAFVLMDVHTEDPRLATAASLGLPVVLVGRPADRHGLDAVDFDTRAAAALLVGELADTGHRHVVAVGETPDVDAETMRFLSDFHEGARAEAARRGLGFDLVSRERAGWAGVEAAADRILADRGDRLGLLARTGQVTEWLVQLAHTRGLRVGEDVSLVSLCTDVTAAALEPAVTHVSPQPRELSRLAMRVLFERIDGEPDVERPARLELLAPAGVERRASVVTYD